MIKYDCCNAISVLIISHGRLHVVVSHKSELAHLTGGKLRLEICGDVVSYSIDLICKGIHVCGCKFGSTFMGHLGRERDSIPWHGCFQMWLCYDIIARYESLGGKDFLWYGSAELSAAMGSGGLVLGMVPRSEKSVITTSG